MNAEKNDVTEGDNEQKARKELRSQVENAVGRAKSVRGKKSAEYQLGADFSVTADITYRGLQIKKAILFQAKMGEVLKLKGKKRKDLEEQCKKLLKVQRGPKILEILERKDGSRELRVLSARGYLDGTRIQRPELSDYLVRKILTTLDGDRDVVGYRKALAGDYNVHIKAKSNI